MSLREKIRKQGKTIEQLEEVGRRLHDELSWGKQEHNARLPFSHEEYNKKSMEYHTEEWVLVGVVMSQCDGCIYLIVGERKDGQGYVWKTSACLCEKEMCAGCIPTYQFSDSHIYKGKMKVENGEIVFKHHKKLKDSVRKVEG